jgi:uncharacterized SAM-binding protein YcdF (DUF218 family)
MTEIKIVKCDQNIRVDIIKEKRWRKADLLFLFLGFILISYFIGIIFYAGFSSVFYFVWLAGGMLLITIGFIPKRKEKIKKSSKACRRFAFMILMLGILFFCLIQTLIISKFSQTRSQSLNYIIVLGAQIRETGPSLILKQRLNAAGDYLIENPETKVILSGGQGNDEPTSEAVGMQKYLMDVYGISQDRTILEEDSTNTYENLMFCKAWIKEASNTVGIVTSNFHMYRAIQIAKKSGYSKVSAIASPSDFFLLPANMVRECIGIIKDSIKGNMDLISIP